jgi:outer membrane receptor for ferrienterochelin and colicins
MLKFLFLLNVLLPSLSQAQTASADGKDLADLSLTELMDIPVDTVYGASKYEQKVTEAPSSISIITSEDIKAYGYRNLGEILRSVPGLYVTSDRSYSFLGFRGFSQPGDFNTGILVLVDGHRINDAIYNLVYIADEAVVDVDMIERLEVIRGPSSSIYGNSAFFGVVNIVTKRGRTMDGLQAASEAGSLGRFKNRATYGRKLGESGDVMVSASVLNSAGNRSLYYPEYGSSATDGIASASDDEHAYHLAGNASWHDLTLNAAFSNRTKKVPTGVLGTDFGTGEMKTRDSRAYVNLQYEHAFDETWKVTGRASYDWQDYVANYPYANGSPPPAVIRNHDGSYSRWARGELQLTRKIFDKHILILGTEYQKNFKLHQENYDEEPYSSYLNIDHSNSTYAFYGQGEFALGGNFLLNSGLRFDHFDSFGNTVNPRLGLIYNLHEKSAIKLLYGQAFRAPNDYELKYESAAFDLSTNLKPETIRTYELVFERYLPPGLRASAAVYRYDINGLIATATNSNGHNTFRNIDSVRAYGTELQLENRTKSGAQILGSYALQRARSLTAHQDLSNSPQSLAKLNASLPLIGDKVSTGIEAQYNGKVITPGRQKNGDFTVVNWTLTGQKFARGLELSASIYNLLDRRYSTASSANTRMDTIEQDRRTFRVKAVYDF